MRSKKTKEDTQSKEDKSVWITKVVKLEKALLQANDEIVKVKWFQGKELIKIE